ncbi:MAG: phosphoglycerate dehydrogenase, partial [Burkholderiales bacterium]|nr:phosphoglycerate dehydrogenase [Burkholderiales bacterium]
ERCAIRYAPQLAQDGHEFRKTLFRTRSVIIPPSVALDAATIRSAPLLRAVGRVSSGAENIDLEACAAAGVEVVRPVTASATAEAEFVIGALLQMLRRVPVVNVEGLLVGRELGGTTVGLVGMSAAARPLARLLAAFGARVVGYDPALHVNDGVWRRWQVEPMNLAELFECCDGVAILLTYFSRYRGLIGERFLSVAKPNQVLVCLAHSSLLDERALADAMTGGRIAAAWFDSLEPGMADPGRPLARVDALQVTPRVASTTLESRSRSAWAVARQIDALLAAPAQPREELKPAPAADFADLADGPAPA